MSERMIKSLRALIDTIEELELRGISPRGCESEIWQEPVVKITLHDFRRLFAGQEVTLLHGGHVRVYEGEFGDSGVVLRASEIADAYADKVTTTTIQMPEIEAASSC